MEKSNIQLLKMNLSNYVMKQEQVIVATQVSCLFVTGQDLLPWVQKSALPSSSSEEKSFSDQVQKHSQNSVGRPSDPEHWWNPAKWP